MTVVNHYPHSGGCDECRKTHKCNWCGGTMLPGQRCTNGRCPTCHAAHCTPGGDVAPGHGYGRSPAQHTHFTDRI